MTWLEELTNWHPDSTHVESVDEIIKFIMEKNIDTIQTYEKAGKMFVHCDCKFRQLNIFSIDRLPIYDIGRLKSVLTEYTGSNPIFDDLTGHNP